MKNKYEKIYIYMKNIFYMNYIRLVCPYSSDNMFQVQKSRRHATKKIKSPF